MTVKELIRYLETIPIPDRDTEVVIETYDWRDKKYVLSSIHDVSRLWQGEAYGKGKWHSVDPLYWIRNYHDPDPPRSL